MDKKNLEAGVTVRKHVKDISDDEKLPKPIYCMGCNIKFVKVGLYRSHLNHRTNTGTSILDRTAVIEGLHVVMCDSPHCCFTSASLKELDVHFKRFPSHALDGMSQSVNVLMVADDKTLGRRIHCCPR